MRILMINVVCGIRSTGRICTDLATALEAQGHEVKIAYGREEVPEQFKKYAVRIGSDLDVKLHGLKARLFDGCGFGSRRVTEKFIEWVKEFDPDVIHLHNLHGYYINIEVLFDYLRTCGKKIIWTLHDCWAFTGHCVFFDYVNCGKWKEGCNKCTQKYEYPARIGPDRSKYNYMTKKRLFTNVPNLILVTPSEWLKSILNCSYLRNYSVRTIPNGVDTSTFRSVESNIKIKYGCQGKRIILGVAAVWDRRKGLDTFIKLSKIIDSSRVIVLVGLSKKQIRKLPHSIIGIERTNNAYELSEMYSAADVFINPTLEDNYPTTNLESIACGTPVITYNTGGSPESAKMFGRVVRKDDIDGIVSIINNNAYYKEKPIDVDLGSMIAKYLDLYGEWI